MKRCKDCGEEKPLEEFYKEAGTRDGHRNDCKKCNLARRAAKQRNHTDSQERRGTKRALDAVESARGGRSLRDYIRKPGVAA